MRYPMKFANNKNPITEIKTDRIILSTPDIKNADLILDSVRVSADYIYPWLPWATKKITAKDIENHINHFIKCHNSEKPSCLFFDIWDNEHDKYLGNVCFSQIEWRNPSFSIEYWLDSRECNKGYMAEAVNALSHVAFRHFRANRIEISTSKDNASAKRIPEKLNFELEAEFVNHHMNYVTKQVSNTTVYACIDENALPKLKQLVWNTASKLTSHDEIFTWAKEVLNPNTFEPEVIVETPWSSVIKINTELETVYLKQTPQDLFLEAEITKLLYNKCGIKNIPEIISTNSNYRCFIMKKCGDLTLRDYFSGKLNLEMLIQALEGYKKLQKATIPFVEDLISLGVPDWRLDQFPALYDDLISDADFLKENGLDPNQQSLLHSYSSKVKELCEKLSGYGVPECLSHSDFHDNNILYDKTTKTTAIIDLGESAINHPFFSIMACLGAAKNRYSFLENEENYKSLEKKAFSGWLDNQKHLTDAIDIIKILLHVYLLFAHIRFVNATCPVELSKIPRMIDRVRKAFVWFIENMDTAYGEL